MIGTAMVIVGFDALGLAGLVRKAEIYPLISPYVTPEIIASLGAMIADTSTLLWLGNLVLTLLKGKTQNFEGVSLDNAVSFIASTLEAPRLDKIEVPLNNVKSTLIRAFEKK
jgi:cytochrome c oxidase subunit 1/terminal oxidase heme-binding subunit I